jgi:predicted transcriptional regulator
VVGKVRKTISVQVKQEIIEKNERGVKIRALVSEYGLPQSTISTVIQQKDRCKATSVKDTLSRILKVRK